MSPQPLPRGNHGRKPPKPPPHSTSGKGACDMSLPAIVRAMGSILIQAVRGRLAR